MYLARTWICRSFVTGVLLTAAAVSVAQSAAFDTASIKPAPTDTRTNGTGFMVAMSKEPPPHGLLTMTASLPVFIMFAYSVEDEAEARAMRARLPEWARSQKYTIIARPWQPDA